MKAVVCAYGEVGHACLQELLALGADVGLVVTHEDTPGETIWFSSVRDLAVSSGIRTIAPEDVNAPGVVGEIAGISPDYLFSFYFRQMIKPPLLAGASRGALNLHGSLLPRYRGRAPVNWAILHGEKESGVTLHYMDEKPDHGDIVGQREVAITRNDTAETLTRKLAAEAQVLLRELYPALDEGTAPRVPQEHADSSYFGGRRPEDGRIDWASGAEDIRNLVRAVTDPWPGAYSIFQDRKLYVWSAEVRPALEGASPGCILIDGEGAPVVATGAGALELLELTWEGGSRRAGTAWVREEGIESGVRFGNAPSEAVGGGT